MKWKLIRYSKALRGLVQTAIWRSRGIRVADRVLIEGAVPYVSAPGLLVLGLRLSFRNLYGRTRLFVRHGARLSIGDHCFINNGCIIESAVQVGDHCLIGDGVQIRDSNYHQIGEGGTVKRAPIRIGRNVWLANGCMILPGVEIGDHSVVGAGAVVTRSVPARSIVAGNPAAIVGNVEASGDWIRR